MLEATAVALRKGAEPGADWLAEVSIDSAIFSSASVALSDTFSAFRLSNASASSMSDISRSAWLASDIDGIGRYAAPKDWVRVLKLLTRWSRIRFSSDCGAGKVALFSLRLMMPAIRVRYRLLICVICALAWLISCTGQTKVWNRLFIADRTVLIPFRAVSITPLITFRTAWIACTILVCASAAGGATTIVETNTPVTAIIATRLRVLAVAISDVKITKKRANPK